MSGPGGIRVTPARAADIAAVQDVIRRAYTPWIARIGREPAPMGEDHEAQVRGGFVRLARAGEDVVGVLVLIPRHGDLLVDNVAVAPEAQGLGIGRLLMARAEAEARGMGLPVVRLYTNVAMTGNAALYERLGYVETHRAEENGFARIFMEKRLA